MHSMFWFDFSSASLHVSYRCQLNVQILTRRSQKIGGGNLAGKLQSKALEIILASCQHKGCHQLGLFISAILPYMYRSVKVASASHNEDC